MTRIATMKAARPPRRSGDLDFGSLGELLGFNVRLAQIAFYRDYVVAMKGLDLTQKQYAVLTLVAVNPGVSQIDLANVLGADRATMMAIVDRLQNRDLLRREPSKIDRRRQELYLTETGVTVQADAEAIIARHEQPFLDRFTPAELDTLMEMLKRLQAVPGEA